MKTASNNNVQSALQQMGIHNEIDVVKAYEMIVEQRSRFSASERILVKRAMLSLYNYKQEQVGALAKKLEENKRSCWTKLVLWVKKKFSRK